MTAEPDPRRGDLVLDQGSRTIRLRAIHQWSTYGGLIEGVPTRRLNEQLIGRLLRNDARFEEALHVIRPIEVEVPGIVTSRGEPSFELPRVQVTATYDSHETIDLTTDADGSTLDVVWFQNAWAFPIDDDVLAQLHQLDWNALARDYLT